VATATATATTPATATSVAPPRAGRCVLHAGRVGPTPTPTPRLVAGCAAVATAVALVGPSLQACRLWSLPTAVALLALARRAADPGTTPVPPLLCRVTPYPPMPTPTATATATATVTPTPRR